MFKDDFINELTKGLPPQHKKAFLDGFHNGNDYPITKTDIGWLSLMKVLLRKALKRIRHYFSCV